MRVHVENNWEHTIRIDGYLKIAYFATWKSRRVGKELPTPGILNAGKQIVSLDRVEKAVIVLDVVAFELDEQIGVFELFSHHFTFWDNPIPLAGDPLEHAAKRSELLPYRRCAQQQWG